MLRGLGSGCVGCLRTPVWAGTGFSRPLSQVLGGTICGCEVTLFYHTKKRFSGKFDGFELVLAGFESLYFLRLHTD